MAAAACKFTCLACMPGRSTKSCQASPMQVLVRLAFGIDVHRNVAMKLAVRSESGDVSEAIHQIIQEA